MSKPVAHDVEETKRLLRDPKKWKVYCEINNRYRNLGYDIKDSHNMAIKEVVENYKTKEEEREAKDEMFIQAGDITAQEKMLLDSMGLGKSGNLRDDIEWIYNNIGYKEVSPADAPSIGAYSHLKKIQADPVLQSEFYKSVWIKILPKSDASEEYLARLNDDGTKVFNVIDRALEALDESENK